MDELQALKNERERQITRIFWLALEIALIFGIPAAIGVYVGKFLLGGGAWLVGSLAVAFISSWALVIKRYRTLNKKMTKLDDQIKEKEAELNTKEEKNV